MASAPNERLMLCLKGNRHHLEWARELFPGHVYWSHDQVEPDIDASALQNYNEIAVLCPQGIQNLIVVEHNTVIPMELDEDQFYTLDRVDFGSRWDLLRDPSLSYDKQQHLRNVQYYFNRLRSIMNGRRLTLFVQAISRKEADRIHRRVRGENVVIITHEQDVMQNLVRVLSSARSLLNAAADVGCRVSINA